jgi:hypothetical protein
MQNIRLAGTGQVYAPPFDWLANHVFFMRGY